MGTAIVVAAPPELARLAEEIRWHEAQAQANARTALEHKAEIGVRLLRAKKLLSHGEFIAWGRAEFRWGQPHLWRHMELGRNHARVHDLGLPADAGWRLILAALKDDEPDKRPKRPKPPGEPFPLDLPRNDYQLVLADPPWQYDSWNKSGTGRVADDHYPTMPLDAILALPVAGICARDAVLLLWVTLPMLPHGLRVIEAWGFTYKTGFLVWGKLNADRSPATGFGRYTRSNAELCLLATCGKGVRPVEGVAIPNLLLSQRGKHSAKPVGQYAVIRRLFGNVRRVELFARHQHDGWDVWGLEAPAHTTVPLLEVAG